MAAEASEEIADQFLAALETTLLPLQAFPFSGVARAQLGPGLRAVFHGAYVIYYIPQPDAVIVVRVLHGARDAAAIARHGGFSP